MCQPFWWEIVLIWWEMMLCCLWDFRSVHLLGIFLCILRPLCTGGPLSTLSTARSEGETGIPWLYSVSLAPPLLVEVSSSRMLLIPPSWGIPGSLSGPWILASLSTALFYQQKSYAGSLSLIYLHCFSLISPLLLLTKMRFPLYFFSFCTFWGIERKLFFGSTLPSFQEVCFMSLDDCN